MRAAYLLILLTIGPCAFGQSGTFVDAKPRLDLICPDEIVSQGDEFAVKARFGPVKSGMPVYAWTVSAGTIIRGQGTPILVVKADHEGIPITASLEIGVGPFWFETLIESCTTAVASMPKAMLVGQFGVKNIGYVELMFDNLFAELWNDPSAIGVIAIGIRNPNERRRLRRWAERLIKGRKFDVTRLIFVDGGKPTLGTFQLWTVPAGAGMPLQFPLDRPIL